MPKNSIINKIKSLTLGKKLIGLGSIAIIIGAFLPWYSDIDDHGIGTTFLGITGPSYLVAYLCIAIGVFALYLIFLEFFNKKNSKFMLIENKVHLYSGVIAIGLLIITASFFFHYKFGIGITNKRAGIGMIMVLIGAIFNIGGSFLVKDYEKKGSPLKENADKFIDNELKSREKRGIEHPHLSDIINQNLEEAREHLLEPIDNIIPKE